MSVGSQCTLTMTRWDGDVPVEGDLLRAVPGGSCYRVDDVRRTPAGRLRLRVTRLGKDACQLGDEGVFGFSWNARARKARR